jgi:hypothetical protein
MATQITLEFDVAVAGTPYGPTQAEAALAAVVLVQNPNFDPVLGQLFGLTVDTDSQATTPTGAKRTLVLNMTGPTAPPAFPCNPITAVPPQLPYPLQKAVTLPGSFLTTPGSQVVGTSDSQIPSLEVNDTVQFQSQLGTFYQVMAISPTSITLTNPYSGTFVADDGAVVMEPAPSNVTCVYSTSPLDDGFVTGPGAQSIRLVYLDADGSGPTTVIIPLRGKYPVVVSFDEIGTILAFSVEAAGAFGNSVGQITLCELSKAPPAIPVDATPPEAQQIVDQAQMLIIRGLAYMPPSYFSFCQQQASAPQLAGEFTLSVGSRGVPTTEDQTSALSPGDSITFAYQQAVNTPFGAVPQVYVVQTVTPRMVTLTTPWAGLNDNPVQSGAMLIDPSPATEPTPEQLAAPLAEFVNPGTAIPPPNLPLPAQTMSPSPTFLSGLFARTLQLALAGQPIVQATIVVS